MRNIILVQFLFFFSMCNSQPVPEKDFEGKFSGELSGTPISATLTVEKKELKGSFILAGKSSTVKGTVVKQSTTGIVTDDETGAVYNYRGSIEKNELRLSITFPELGNKEIEMIMKKEDTGAAKQEKQSGNTKDRNPLLVGLWKYSEILGAGGGVSMTNETMLQFIGDGSFYTWPGQSSGPGGYYRGEDKSKATKGEWYTKGRQLYLVDPATKESQYVNFSVSESGLLFTGDNGKRIYKRMN